MSVTNELVQLMGEAKKITERCACHKFDRLGFLGPESKIIYSIVHGSIKKAAARLESRIGTGSITKDSFISAAKYIAAGINPPRNWHFKGNIQNAEKLIEEKSKMTVHSFPSFKKLNEFKNNNDCGEQWDDEDGALYIFKI